MMDALKQIAWRCRPQAMERPQALLQQQDSGKGAQPNDELSCIESLVEGPAGTCVRVRLKSVTLLSIGKVSDQGKTTARAEGKKGQKGNKGKSMSEAIAYKIQLVYFGDDMGRAICTLATGDDINWIPATFHQNAYVDISASTPQPGQPGVL